MRQISRQVSRRFSSRWPSERYPLVGRHRLVERRRQQLTERRGEAAAHRRRVGEVEDLVCAAIHHQVKHIKHGRVRMGAGQVDRRSGDSKSCGTGHGE